MTQRTVKALLLDDDENVLAILHHFLSERIPNLTIETSSQPETQPGFDVYLIDNDFGGRHVGARLVTEARRQAPDALIVAYSSNLDRALLKRLINASCDGAFDKDSVGERAEMLRLVEAFAVQRMHSAETSELQRSSLLRDMSDLLRSWNSRLGEEERSRTEQGARPA